MLNLYIHIPICQQKCPYCHFFSIKQNSLNVNNYIKNLKQEFIHKTKTFQLTKEKISTIYFGGGTPSLLSSNNINKILKFIKKNSILTKNVEITLEINPTSIKPTYLKELKNIGINRFSFGIQSLNKNLVKFHKRQNNHQKLQNLLDFSTKLGITYNLDFIYAWPQQTLKQVQTDLNFALNNQADHLSFYELEIKKHTPIYKLHKTQHNIFPKETILIQMRQLIEKTLKENAWEHYEISNWCKNKKYSQHNFNFWKGQEYLGIGLNAHSFINNKIIINDKNLNNYYNNTKSFTITPLTNAEYALQYIMKALRSNQGISLKLLNANDKTLIWHCLRNLPQQYFIKKNQENITLSETGWLKYNLLLSKISETIYENYSQSKNQY